jgi:hypothetical protein
MGNCISALESVHEKDGFLHERTLVQGIEERFDYSEIDRMRVG